MCFKWLFGGGKNKELGKVVHYFDKIQVAVIKLGGVLKVGDKIKIVRADHEFTETVGSMQVDHKDIVTASKGEEVAIKVNEPTKDGALIYKV